MDDRLQRDHREAQRGARDGHRERPPETRLLPDSGDEAAEPEGDDAGADGEILGVVIGEQADRGQQERRDCGKGAEEERGLLEQRRDSGLAREAAVVDEAVGEDGRVRVGEPEDDRRDEDRQRDLPRIRRRVLAVGGSQRRGEDDAVEGGGDVADGPRLDARRLREARGRLYPAIKKKDPARPR